MDVVVQFDELELGDRRLSTACSRAVRRYLDARAIGDMGYARVECEVVATRGARLVLAKNRLVQAAAADVCEHVVYEIDDAEHISPVVAIGDVDAAIDVLEERFAVGEGVDAIDVIRPYARVMRAYNAGEWASLRSELTDDFVLIDHRPVALGRMGPDEWVQSLKVTFELSSRRGDSKTYHAWGHGRGVIEFLFLSGSGDGAFFEHRHHGVVEGRDGRICRVEFYPVEQLDAALSRFEELGARSG